MQQLSLISGNADDDAHPEFAVDRLGVTLRGLPGDELSAGELDSIIEVLRAAFNGGPSWFDLPIAPVSHLRWKLADHPWPTLAIMGEDRSGELVGFAALWQRRWRVRGVERTGRSGGELGLTPSLQLRGLALVGATVAMEWLASDFFVHFGSHPSLRKLLARNGAHDVGDRLTTMVRPLSVTRFVREREPERTGSSRTRAALERRTGRKARPWPARWLEWHRRLLYNRLQHPRPRVQAKGVTLRTIHRFDARFDALFERVAPLYDLIQVRDSKFLNWRYADPRAGGFVVRVAEQGTELLGYAVTRVTPHFADLADLIAVPGRQDVALALAADAVDQASAGGASALRTWMLTRHPYYDVLRSLGFIPVRGVVTPGFRAMALDPSELAFLEDPNARLHLMPGDSDHV